MSGLEMTVEQSPPVSWHLRPVALVAVGVARFMVRLPPQKLRQVLCFLRRGTKPADVARTLRARNAVVSVSVACAGPRCLQRSIATVLLCRLSGVWPQWCTGVVTEPFTAHAWVAVDGRPVGENAEAVRDFTIVMSVP